LETSIWKSCSVGTYEYNEKYRNSINKDESGNSKITPDSKLAFQGA